MEHMNEYKGNHDGLKIGLHSFLTCTLTHGIDVGHLKLIPCLTSAHAQIFEIFLLKFCNFNNFCLWL